MADFTSGIPACSNAIPCAWCTDCRHTIHSDCFFFRLDPSLSPCLSLWRRRHASDLKMHIRAHMQEKFCRRLLSSTPAGMGEMLESSGHVSCSESVAHNSSSRAANTNKICYVKGTPRNEYYTLANNFVAITNKKKMLLFLFEVTFLKVEKATLRGRNDC